MGLLKNKHSFIFNKSFYSNLYSKQAQKTRCLINKNKNKIQFIIINFCPNLTKIFSKRGLIFSTNCVIIIKNKLCLFWHYSEQHLQ